jgi:ribose transport system permease protein
MSARTKRLNLGMDRFSGIYLWLMIILVFSVWKPTIFPTMATVHSLASQQSIIAILALAVLIPLRAGVYDLSVGATINLVCIVATILLTNKEWPIAPTIAFCIAIGVVIGALNGFFVVALKVDSFIATLGMATIVGAFQTIVSSNQQPVQSLDSGWINLTQSMVAGFQIVVIYLIVLAVVLWWVMERTPIGRYLLAIGGNAETARLSGVRVGKWQFLSLVAASTLAAVGGVLYASLFGPSLTFGAGMLLPAYAAAFLGSSQFRPGRFNVLGTLLAVYVLATGVRGLQLVTGVQWLSDMFNGCALLLAVAFAGWRQRVSRQTEARGQGPRSVPAGDAVETDPAYLTPKEGSIDSKTDAR